MGVAPDGRILPLASQRFSVASETPISWAARLVEYVLITTLMVSQYDGMSSSFRSPFARRRAYAFPGQLIPSYILRIAKSGRLKKSLALRRDIHGRASLLNSSAAIR